MIQTFGSFSAGSPGIAFPVRQAGLNLSLAFRPLLTVFLFLFSRSFWYLQPDSSFRRCYAFEKKRYFILGSLCVACMYNSRQLLWESYLTFCLVLSCDILLFLLVHHVPQETVLSLCAHCRSAGMAKIPGASPVPSFSC